MSDLILQLANPKRASFVRWMLVPVPFLPSTGGQFAAVNDNGEAFPCVPIWRNLLAVRVAASSDHPELSKWVVTQVEKTKQTDTLPADWNLQEVVFRVGVFSRGRHHDLKVSARDLFLNLSGGSISRLEACVGDADFCLRLWVDIFPDTGIVDWWATVTYASSLNTSYNVTIDAMSVEIPSAKSITPADPRPWVNSFDLRSSFTAASSISLCRSVTLHDGASIAIRGMALMASSKECLRNYQAVVEAGSGVAMTATADSWEGHWVSPYGNVPLVEHAVAQTEAKNAIQLREKYLNGELGIPPSIEGAALASRAVKYPGQQGNQLDFGVTYGAAELANPSCIALLEQRVCADFLRGYMLSRLSTNPQDKIRHRTISRGEGQRVNWVSYNGRTWDRSEDLLDKIPPFNPENGWLPYDEQHRSHNQLAAYLRLVCDPRVIQFLNMMMHVDYADARLVQRSQPSPRGIGRQIGSWAQIDVATGHSYAVWLAEDLILRAQPVSTAEAWGQDDIDVYGTIYDSRYPVFDPEGDLKVVVSVWEHALMLFGVHQYLAAQKLSKSSAPIEKATKMARDCARIVLLSLDDGQVCTAFSTRPYNGETLTMKPGNSAGTAGWVIYASYLARAVYSDGLTRVPVEQYNAWNLLFPIPNRLGRNSEEAEWLAALPRKQNQVAPNQSKSN